MLFRSKNLEVLSAWAQKSENKYKKTIKRSVWLSENGTNSRTYADMYLKEQAAGFAYAWKKLKKLDGIDAMQWHNWIDHPDEYSLRIGLRKFPNDPDDPMVENSYGMPIRQPGRQPRMRFSNLIRR